MNKSEGCDLLDNKNFNLNIALSVYIYYVYAFICIYKNLYTSYYSH